MNRSLRVWAPVLVVIALSLAVTVTSVGHDFTYDDRGVILGNERLHQLRNIAALFGESYWPSKYGSDGYRPVTTSLFTMQWVAGGGAAWVFHLCNIVLAAAAAAALYWCALSLLPAAAAFVAAALFAVHPVHVEVTGNMVGQSELVVALCLLLAVGVYVRARREPAMGARAGITIVILFLVALFAKEHAVVLPALFVAAELTVVRGGPWRQRLRIVRPLGLALVAAVLLYTGVRATVRQDFTGFIPFAVFRYLRMGTFDRIGTMMNVLPTVARLLVFPAHLSADYSPAEVLVAHGVAPSQLPGYFILAGLPLIALALRRRAPVAAFGLLWIIVSYLPVSNLIVPTGFIVAERTLFLPSAGVVMLAGALAVAVQRRGQRREQRLAMAALGVLLLAGTVKSVRRQPAWRNNDAFVAQMVKDAPLGYRAHSVLAQHAGLYGRKAQMEREYRTAIRLFPYDAVMTMALADVYTRSGHYAAAATLFEWTYGVEPAMKEGRYMYVYALAKLGRWRDAREQAFAALRIPESGDVRLFHAAIAAADTALGRRPRR
ncbi:MAG: hypothetical protein H0W68_04550 [Gemmatimonadaceae bacterium]|nr:hypothetical protein [Gemmatimonadaceae bacterium]